MNKSFTLFSVYIAVCFRFQFNAYTFSSIYFTDIIGSKSVGLSGSKLNELFLVIFQTT